MKPIFASACQQRPLSANLFWYHLARFYLPLQGRKQKLEPPLWLQRMVNFWFLWHETASADAPLSSLIDSLDWQPTAARAFYVGGRASRSIVVASTRPTQPLMNLLAHNAGWLPPVYTAWQLLPPLVKPYGHKQNKTYKQTTNKNPPLMPAALWVKCLLGF